LGQAVDYSKDLQPTEWAEKSRCAAALLDGRCPLWVISVISKRGTDVGFTPNSDRDSDMANGR
jgi:hypothetical protein